MPETGRTQGNSKNETLDKEKRREGSWRTLLENASGVGKKYIFSPPLFYINTYKINAWGTERTRPMGRGHVAATLRREVSPYN